MSMTGETDGLRADVDELKRAIEDAQRTRQRTSHSALTVSIVLGLVVLAFVMVGYFTLCDEWTTEKLSRQITREARNLSPVAMAQLDALGTALGPVFAEAAREQFTLMKPELSAKAEAELDRLGQDVNDRVRRRLDQTQDRLLVATREAVLASVPGLAEPAAQRKLERRLETLTQDSVQRVLIGFDERFSGDTGKMQEAVHRLDPGASGASRTALQKKFIHLWLQIIDQEIMGS